MNVGYQIIKYPYYQSEVEWEMDDYTRQRLIELGLDEPEKEIGSDLISKI